MGKKIVISGLPDGAGPGDIVGAFTNEAGIDGRLIGKISFWGKRAIVEVDQKIYDRVIQVMDGNSIAGHQVQVTREAGLEQVEKYVQGFIRLVQMEREEEMERFLYEVKKLSGEERQKHGRALLHLYLQKEDKSGLEGYLCHFSQTQGDYFFRTHISPGDGVILSPGDPLSSQRQRGLVYGLTREAITLFLEKPPKDWIRNGSVRMDLYLNEDLYSSIFSALRSLKSPGDLSSRVCDILLGFEEPSIEAQEGETSFLDPLLNLEQQDAVERALLAQDLFLIEGGPGTGKTRVLQEIIRQTARSGKTLLVITPTLNGAVALMKKMKEEGIQAALVGYPFQEEYTLFASMRNTEAYQEAVEQSAALSSLTEEEDQETFYEQINSLYELALSKTLESFPVLCTTNHCCHSPLLSSSFFDLLIMDDAGQVMEPLSIIPILKAKKVILAGDPHSLAPPLLNARAGKEGLAVSLLERLLDLYGEKISASLTKEYRMRPVLNDFFHQSFYPGKLTVGNEKTHQERTCRLLPGSTPGSLAVNREEALLFFDTSTMKARECSWYNQRFCENPVEADLVVEIVSSFLQAGLKPSSMGVITPYPEQSNLIRKALGLDDLLVNVPQAFQGQEKDCIILSLVRNNEKGWLGLLKDIPSMNLSLSRARNKVILIGSQKTITSHPFYRSLTDYVKEHGYYYSL